MSDSDSSYTGDYAPFTVYDPYKSDYTDFVQQGSNRPAVNWQEGLDSLLIDAVNTQTVTARTLDKSTSSYTSILRSGWINAYLGDKIREVMNLNPIPIVRGVELFPHQLEALKFMKDIETRPSNNGLCGGIMMMTMGMGKTLTAISYCLATPKREPKFPCLVIASKTLMSEWKTQGFEKFFGTEVRVLYLHKDYMGKDINTVNRKTIMKYDFVISTYDTVLTAGRKSGYVNETLEFGQDGLMKGRIVAINNRERDQSDSSKVKGIDILFKTPWERVICDESQKFANPKTKVYQYMLSLYGRYKWCLTGTPISNYTTDIWAQFRFCGYDGVTKAAEWKKGYMGYMNTHNLTRSLLSINYKSADITLPPKYDHIKRIVLAKEERQCYDFILGIARNVCEEMLLGMVGYAGVLALFTRLRQCCIAPWLITPESKRGYKPTHKVKKDILLREIKKNGGMDEKLGVWIHDKEGTAGAKSAKMMQTVKTLREIPTDQKTLVFSMSTACLDLLEYACGKDPVLVSQNYKIARVDGDVVGRDRDNAIANFRTSSKINVMFLTYKVGSMGLNLTEATNVICMEPWWSPVVMDQAEARCYRTGQTKAVNVHKILIADTIEERVVEICEDKKEMAETILEGTEVKPGTGLTKFTMAKILGL